MCVTSFIGRPPGTPPPARDGPELARAPAPSAPEANVISITAAHAHRKSQPRARRATIPGAAPDASRCPTALPRPDCPGRQLPESARSEVTDPGLDIGPRPKPR